MIKELILSLALSAASSLPFLDSPKKAIQELPYLNLSVTLGLYQNGDTMGSGEYSYYEDGPRDGEEDSFDYEDTTGNYYVMFGNDGCEFEITYDSGTYSGYFYVDGSLFGGLNAVDSYSGFNDVLIEDVTGITLYFEFAEPVTPTTQSLSATLGVSSNFVLTTNLTNCVILSIPTLPDTFTASDVGNQYVIQAAANSGGYGFTSSSLSVTGAQVSNITYSQEQGNTGYYNGLNFTLTLQAADCTISITAYLPTWTLTSELNNCSVSPSLPATFNYGFVQTYTFTANSGYAFNNVVTQWEITGANIGEITYSSLLYGNLYSQVSIELGFTGGNASVKVTAAQYDINSYQEGYDNGYTNGDTAGYNRGYSQGLTAGNSYGVWNWLKQAALTTGEFLSVPLLPGFSIGALLTAIAGLVIIWLFIKGFLFKS